MEDVIRQHYVPRTYMKHFSHLKDGKDFIFFATLPFNSEIAIKEISVRNICLEKNIYTLPGATQQERMLLEKIYSDVFESEYNRVYNMLVDPKKISLTQAEREFIITTVITMYYRTTNWNRFAYTVMDDIIERGYYMTKQTSHDHFMFGERKISIAGKTVDELKKEHREETRTIIALDQLKHSMKLAGIRSVADRIMITKLGQGSDEFITSDNPVSCNNLKGGHLVPIDPTNVFSLALDPKHSLTLLPAHTDPDRFTIHRSSYAEDVSLIPMLGLNRGQEQSAQKFVLGTGTGLAGYLAAKAEIENPESGERFKKARILMKTINQAF